MTRHSLQGLGGDLKGEAITEGEAQYLGRGKTDGTVGARIGRIRGSLGGQRNPIFIGVRVGITIGACCLNSSDRSPELIGVLSFENAIVVSARLMFSRANSRALCGRFR
jgi:hypothetical protein